MKMFDLLHLLIYKEHSKTVSKHFAKAKILLDKPDKICYFVGATISSHIELKKTSKETSACSYFRH